MKGPAMGAGARRWWIGSLQIVAATLLLIVVVAWLSGAFHAKTLPGRTEAASSSQTDTSIVAAELRDTPQYTTALGTVRAVHESSVGSRLMARVRKVHVTAGQTVSAGDVMVELDEADIQAAVKRMAANVQAAKARLAQAESELEKITSLAAQNAATQRELESARRVADVAKADLASAQHSEAETRSQLEHATIKAPMTGIVIDKRIEEGDLARPGQTLVVLYDPTRLQLVASVPETTAIGLNVDDEVGVEIDAIDLQCAARVSEIVPQASSSSRSFLVKVTGPCPPGVYSGMFARVLIPQGTRKQLLVPQAAVGRIGQVEMVVVSTSASAADPRSERRYVQTGATTDDGMVEILTGLKAGEMVLAQFGI